MNFPKISCICLTHRNIHFLGLATECFYNQTYPNKEMIVVSDRNNSLMPYYQRTYPGVKIIYTEPETYTIGEKRNIGVEHSSGEYIATWDDDDISHYRRLEFEYKYIIKKGKSACCLKRVCLYNYQTDFYWVAPQRIAYSQTLLAKKDRFPKYESLNYGEDTRVSKYFLDNNLLCHLDLPFLYIYTYSGNNLTPIMKWKNKVFYSTTFPITKGKEHKIVTSMKNNGGVEHHLNLDELWEDIK